MNRLMVCWGVGSLVFVFFSCLTPSSSQAEMPRNIFSARRLPSSPGISWHNNLQSGWAESRRRRVPMVIFITTDRCKYCDAMRRNTWCDDSVRSRLRDFVAIRLTPQQNSATLGRINVKMYPTTLMGVPEGKIVSHREGYQPPAALHQLLTESESAHARR